MPARLVALPLWLGDGLADSWFPVVSAAMVATPAIAALLVVLARERPTHKARVLALVMVLLATGRISPATRPSTVESTG